MHKRKMENVEKNPNPKNFDLNEDIHIKVELLEPICEIEEAKYELADETFENDCKLQIKSLKSSNHKQFQKKINKNIKCDLCDNFFSKTKRFKAAFRNCS